MKGEIDKHKTFAIHPMDLYNMAKHDESQALNPRLAKNTVFDDDNPYAALERFDLSQSQFQDYLADFAAKRVTQLRLNSGMSAKQLSLSIGKEASYIGAIENGRGRLSWTTFADLCNFFAIRPLDFFDEEIKDPVIVREIIHKLKKMDPDALKALNLLMAQLENNQPEKVAQ